METQLLFHTWKPVLVENQVGPVDALFPVGLFKWLRFLCVAAPRAGTPSFPPPNPYLSCSNEFTNRISLSLRSFASPGHRFSDDTVCYLPWSQERLCLQIQISFLMVKIRDQITCNQYRFIVSHIQLMDSLGRRMDGVV